MTDDWTAAELVRAFRGLQDEVREQGRRIEGLTFVRTDVYTANRAADLAAVEAMRRTIDEHEAQHRWINRALFVAVMGLVANLAAVLAGALTR